MRRRSSKPTGVLTLGLRRLGMAIPPPFVGRTEEIEGIARGLHEAPTLIVHGAVGSGKTRLARHLAAHPDQVGVVAATYVRCCPGDSGPAIRARAERLLHILPGSLSEEVAGQPLLLIIDDAHHLQEDEAVSLLAELGAQPDQTGRLMVLTRDVLPLRRDHRRYEMDLGGLDQASARELWSHHEELYGPTPAKAVDAALARTRGMPLALRREYARAAFGADAWELSALPENSLRALQAVAVIGIPAAPAAVAALLGAAPEPALIELVSRQLLDPQDDGRFAIHDVVRDQVLSEIEPDLRRQFERAAADLVSTVGRGRADGRRLAWDAGDDGALGPLDPVDRMRWAVRHLVAAGDLSAAAQRLVEDREIATRHGGGGEVVALIDIIDVAPRGTARDRRRGARSDGFTPDLLRGLAELRVAIAIRQGRVAEALEIATTAADPDGFDPVALADLQFRAGDVDNAVARLAELGRSERSELRCRAAAALAEIELMRGNGVRAERLANAAFERDRATVGERERAALHLALAAVEEYAGRVTAARAALSRAASSGRLEATVAALIESRRAMCLSREGRISEAETALAEAERSALEADAIAVADEIRRHRALVLARRGRLVAAGEALTELVASRRQRGDEVGALEAELDLASVLARRGELAAAAELAAACRGSAARRGLRGFEDRATVIAATIDVCELRLSSARDQLSRLGNKVAASISAQAATLLREVDAWAQGKVPRSRGKADDGDEIHDDIDAGRVRAQVALAAGDCAVALDAATQVAVRAERAGRTGEVADALAVVARLQLARGDRAAAGAAAARAAREAQACGLTQGRVVALLVLAALARDDEDISAAFTYARDAAQMALAAGLPVERLAAAEALDAIAGASDSSRCEVKEVRCAAAATMSQPALDAAARLLADLGLTTVRPFRLVSASGQESFVADANPELLSLGERNLAVDGIREVVYRDGSQIANLRRRSLLKRLLFLFAGEPGRVFSKEEIVEKVWNVEYHPLRHDAALFTNIMRIRRLLGEDGAELIRVSEDGYRFVAPKDFLFVEAAQTN